MACTTFHIIKCIYSFLFKKTCRRHIFTFVIQSGKKKLLALCFCLHQNREHRTHNMPLYVTYNACKDAKSASTKTYTTHAQTYKPKYYTTQNIINHLNGSRF